ncbi:MAG: UDP-4-amino-4,6-dideoxy-N-acetyl-beta-L-altrosamine N-acetyltransferase [Candidatus Omnitrophica bacterium]|nr:UDP-4-amino-4,6-dideoxy-N-acetyl-beta-L-altrosamine N-acetyltransferase [Candidatus Omnitrophota bacterium]
MISFVDLQQEHLELVMGWRLKPEVSQFMFTDIECDLEKQRQWFARIVRDRTCRYWVVRFQGLPIGVVNLAGIDPVHRRCTAGYYIGESAYRNIGAMIPPYVYNHVFRDMGFRKIYGEVIAGNGNVLKMHALHGFREVGVYHEHVYKDGRFHDVVLIELLAEDWLKQKRYQGYVASLTQGGTC